VWWGNVNKPLSPESYELNRSRAVDYLSSRERLFVVDGYAGADERYRVAVRVVCSLAYHALFMHNMLIRPTPQELESFTPDFHIFNAGGFSAGEHYEGVGSKTR
jgi:phosphoenolpyruvate carboxykinase (ATP)